MIAIVNYGVGNIMSLKNFLERFDNFVSVTDAPETILMADLVVLPGVGHFGPAMRQLNRSGLAEALGKRHDAGGPILGICLGMQLMFESSLEDPDALGFGWFSGHVDLFSSELITPHMGWNSVLWDGVLADYYFVHSYKVSMDLDENAEIGYASYGEKFPAIIRHKNICGVQFHPEISSNVGITFMKNLMEAWQL
ncbi:imidazole glycerol phosphate synthase subunit HisH [Fusibacter tunisiensis]|uniref:Imidazole glycerol phosphate synthase subunit HisH n=1 Tax=Fusibacter tunisiensis TaxID=1008308 RepID=A0ABS2MPT5_9FIRM|nr:glutamine amidotransferase [Fusibacter tunisiensis]